MPDLQAKLLIFILKMFALLPFGLTRRLGIWFGHVLWHINGRARITTEINIGLCFPELDKDEQRELVKTSLQQTCITALEMGPVWFWPKDRVSALVESVEGAELMQQAMDAGQGVILLAPHLGNWELLGHYLGAHFPTTCLFQPPKSDLLGNMIQAARLRTGIRLTPTNRKGVMTLLKTLKTGELIGILPDQEPEPESGVFAPFFGVDALTMTLASNLARKTGARVFSGVAKRKKGSLGFDVVFVPCEEKVCSRDRLESASALNRTVENCINQARPQYQWEYKRFKQRPNNEPRFYPKGK